MASAGPAAAEAPICGKCRKEPPARRCEQCQLLYCQACASKRHSKGAFRRHEVTDIPKCDECEDVTAMLTCNACELSFCQACSEEMHAVGAMAEHQASGKFVRFDFSPRPAAPTNTAAAVSPVAAPQAPAQPAAAAPGAAAPAPQVQPAAAQAPAVAAAVPALAQMPAAVGVAEDGAVASPPGDDEGASVNVAVASANALLDEAAAAASSPSAASDRHSGSRSPSYVPVIDDRGVGSGMDNTASSSGLIPRISRDDSGVQAQAGLRTRSNAPGSNWSGAIGGHRFQGGPGQHADQDPKYRTWGGWDLFRAEAVAAAPARQQPSVEWSQHLRLVSAEPQRAMTHKYQTLPHLPSLGDAAPPGFDSLMAHREGRSTTVPTIGSLSSLMSGGGQHASAAPPHPPPQGSMHVSYASPGTAPAVAHMAPTSPFTAQPGGMYQRVQVGAHGGHPGAPYGGHVAQMPAHVAAQYNNGSGAGGGAGAGGAEPGMHGPQRTVHVSVPNGQSLIGAGGSHSRGHSPRHGGARHHSGSAMLHSHAVQDGRHGGASPGGRSPPTGVPPQAPQSRGGQRQSGRSGGFNPRQMPVDIDAVASGADTRTTLMVRNIPNKYSQKMLLDEINETHTGTYDFFYLPIDFKNRCNVGYAFMNFIDFRDIVSFYHKYNGQKWRLFNSEKICQLSYGRIQGKDSLVTRFQNSSLLDKEAGCRPLLFQSSGPNKGQPVPFPTRSSSGRGHSGRSRHHHGSNGHRTRSRSGSSGRRGTGS